MKVLAGIILLHFLVLIRAQFPDRDSVPYASVFILSLLITGYVVFMMYNMDSPAP